MGVLFWEQTAFGHMCGFSPLNLLIPTLMVYGELYRSSQHMLSALHVFHVCMQAQKHWAHALSSLCFPYPNVKVGTCLQHCMCSHMFPHAQTLLWCFGWMFLFGQSEKKFGCVGVRYFFVCQKTTQGTFHGSVLRFYFGHRNVCGRLQF